MRRLFLIRERRALTDVESPHRTPRKLLVGVAYGPGVPGDQNTAVNPAGRSYESIVPTGKPLCLRVYSTDGGTRAAPAPAEVAEGPTVDRVIAALGQPQRTAKIGDKEIYFYKDLKVTFVNGKVKSRVALFLRRIHADAEPVPHGPTSG